MTAAHDRIRELLTDRALVGLGQREQIELAELLVQVQDVDIAAFDRAAAAIALGALGPIEPIPADLAARIEQAALNAPVVRPASDYTTTRQLDKLAPGLVMTQVDEIIDPEPIAPESSEREPSVDFTKTLAVAERPAASPARPGMLTQEPESIPTLARPNDPYVVKKIGTTPHAFAPSAPAPLPRPTPLVPPTHSSAPVQRAASPYPSAPALAAVSAHASGPARHRPSPSGPMPSPYARDPRMAAAPFANVVPLPSSRAPSRAFAIAGWVAAAACLLLAVGAFALRTGASGPVAALPTTTATATSSAQLALTPSASTGTPAPSAALATLTPAELRDELLAAAGTARAEWTATKDPLGKAATGEVVWNGEQQKGTMRFRGLAKNDPARAQYQLWIFDKTRDEKYPVDGGVFDVDSESGDVVVPIRATLPVNAPVVFAVTLEKPGGVVVSKRDRLVVTAKMPAG